MDTSLLVWIILAPLLGAIMNGLLYFYHIKKVLSVKNILFLRPAKIAAYESKK